MENDQRYFERAIEILFESKERDYKKILYKVAMRMPQALVEAVDGLPVPAEVEVQQEAVTDTAPAASNESHDQNEDANEKRLDDKFHADIIDRVVAAGFKTHQIADAAGVSHTTVYKWKHKTKSPNPIHAERLHKLLVNYRHFSSRSAFLNQVNSDEH